MSRRRPGVGASVEGVQLLMDEIHVSSLAPFPRVLGFDLSSISRWGKKKRFSLEVFGGGVLMNGEGKKQRTKQNQQKTSKNQARPPNTEGGGRKTTTCGRYMSSEIHSEAQKRAPMGKQLLFYLFNNKTTEGKKNTKRHHPPADPQPESFCEIRVSDSSKKKETSICLYKSPGEKKEDMSSSDRFPLKPTGEK